jgi:hypothetical protein
MDDFFSKTFNPRFQSFRKEKIKQDAIALTYVNKNKHKLFKYLLCKFDSTNFIHKVEKNEEITFDEYLNRIEKSLFRREIFIQDLIEEINKHKNSTINT